MTYLLQTWSTHPSWAAEEPYWCWSLGQRSRSPGSNVPKLFPTNNSKDIEQCYLLITKECTTLAWEKQQHKHNLSMQLYLARLTIYLCFLHVRIFDLIWSYNLLEYVDILNVQILSPILHFHLLYFQFRCWKWGHRWSRGPGREQPLRRSYTPESSTKTWIFLVPVR